MKIDLWFDFVCPFCYMGDKQFKEALSRFESLKDLEINYRSFQLDTRKPLDKSGDTVENFAKKYNMPLSKAKHIMGKTEKKVESVGLSYNYKDIIPANTFDAHRLNFYAKEFDKDKEMAERIMKAHFADGLDICNPAVLANLATEVGLDKDEVIKMLNSDKYASQIANDRKEAKELKVDVVPTLIFNGKVQHRISGILSLKDYTEFLNKSNQ